MKKIYLLVAIFLSLFPIDSFASIENGFNLKKGFSASQINTNSVLINKTVSVLLDPISNPTASSTSICEGDTLTLTANPSEPLVTPYTFKWTGPNGYISTDENPVINNVTTANTGIYTLTIYDITNTPIDTKNTPFVTINAKIDPEFDATLPAICKGGIAPLLSTTSTNGIRGSWNPSVVSNTSTATYLFTPDSGQCANTLFFTIFVINNVIPKFTLPTSICLNDTPPVLPDISNNGIVGTWSPGTVSNTATGDYTFNPTPNIGQCALPITVQIIINPLFAIFTPAIPPICSGDFLTPLPTTSTNGITGNWSPATNNTATTTYTFTPDGGQCATATTDVTILVNPNIIPTFSFVTSICENDTAPLLPTISDNGITGTWNTSTVSNTTTGTYTFTSAGGQCTNPAPPITVTVKPYLTPTFSFVTSICENDTAPLLPTISDNGITGTWNTPTVSNTTSGTYTFTSASGQCTNPTPPITVTVKPYLTPIFSFITSICENDTAPLLPTISDNGITGTWNTPTVSNTTTGTYTFTSASGQCTNPAPPITVTVKPYLTPTFSFVTSICENDTAPLLPTISDNGITGTWNTPTVSNTTTGTYTFTSAGGQCTNLAPPITVTVKPYLTPIFSFITSICENDTAPLLPTISDNGIAGTWNTPTVSNTTTGTYTFTSAGGQCTNPTPPITVTVKPYLTPIFSFVTSICENDTAPLLPTISDNGITGTWNTPTVSNTTTGTYTFTSAGGQCTNPAPPITVTVKPYLTPIFSFITSICENDTAPLLPTISDNGITGTWNTPTVSNTTTGTYTFTSASGQCTNPAPPITITVNPNIVPTFDLIPDVCYGSSIIPTLPTTSNNNITGTWNPAIVSNTASTTYTFTPTAGICATIATLNINVNTIIPDFDPILPICKNANAPTLSLTSNNLITGKWMPPTIDTSLSGIYTYTFTPDAEQCATTINMLITINPTDATFLPVNDICSGDALAPLPTTSINGVIGSWSPPMDNTTTTKYTFTPIAGQCATTPVEMTIVVNQKTIPSFTAITPICSGSTQPVLPTTSTNSISGNWNPAIVSNTTSGTYTFTPTAGQCALTTTLNAIVYPSPTDLALKTTDVFNEKPDGIIEIVSVTSGSSPYQYSINNSSFTTNTIYSDLTPGSYTVTVRDSNGCEFSKVTPISSICIFPNAITPNNDSYNDTFNLKGCDVDSLKLFNRYGKEVKSYTNYSDQWDGTNSKGESLPDGTYFYVAEISDGTSKSGWVFIAR